MTPVSPIGGGSGFTGEARHWATAVAVTRAKHCWITLSSMARAGFNHTDLHQRENILLSKPSTLSPSRSTPTHTMGNAENCESMRPTTMDSPASGDLSSYVTGLLVIMHCLFAHLITGGHSSTYHSKTKDTLTPTLRQSTSFGDVPSIYGSGIGLSATPVALWSALVSAITRGIPTAYGPVASSRSGTSRFGILEPF